MWNELYYDRVILIRKFVDDFGLKVDEKHQSTLNEFISNAAVLTEYEQRQSSINDMVSKFTYEVRDQGFGNFFYLINMENTTNVTFDFFGCTLEVLDGNGTIVDTGYTGEVRNFAPGQKAQLQVYVRAQGASVRFHPNYRVAE